VSPISNKKYLTLGVNFGKKNNPARILIKEWQKHHGKQELSQYVRSLVIKDLSEQKGFHEWKVTVLLENRRILIDEMRSIQAKIKGNGAILQDKYGVDIATL